MSLTYDPSGMYLPHGELSPTLLSQRAAHLEDARRTILQSKNTRPLGWLDLPSDRVMRTRIKQVVAATKKFDTLLVLGIGGSDLGARAILQALPSKQRVLFAGDTTDPDALASILSQLNLKKIVVNIISKSGDTLEPMSTFFILRDLLKKQVGKNFIQQIVATTDANQGTLHDLAHTEGYHTLIVPDDVGGRFSVLSDVGLFPAAWAGVHTEQLLAGAAAQVELFRAQPVEQQATATYALLHAESYQRYGRHLFVFMPYAARLTECARWYRQLIAESLGKTTEKHAIGPTPIAALGPTDQHSQLQLYMDGPSDKIITFLEIGSFTSKLRVPKTLPEAGRLSNMKDVLFEDLIHAERRATADALSHAHRPNGTITLPKLDTFHLGELFQFFMLSTAYLGELLHVNAYDQPGVEDSKRRFREWLDTRSS